MTDRRPDARNGVQAPGVAAYAGRIFPDNEQPIQAFDGRYGPYVKCEKETRSLARWRVTLSK